MKSTLLSFLLVAVLAQVGQGQIRDSLLWIKLEPGKEITIKGDLASGFFMENLSWAWNSSNACFPATQSKKFTGKHVLYAADLPSNSTMEVTVIPNDKNANFSIYAYEVGQISENNLVPNLPSCIRCEADHKWDRNYAGKTQDHTRTVKDLVAIRNPYQVVIGVTGADGLAKGGYTLKVKLMSR